MKITYDIYPQYEKSILKLVYAYCRKSPFQFDELLSEANQGFIHAVDTYDHNKAGFHTHLHTTVNGRLRNFIKKIDPLSKKQTELNDTLVLSKTPSPEENAIFNNLINSMSSEAVEVIDTILNTPLEMFELIKTMTSNRQGHMHLFRKNVTCFFKEKGWNCAKVNKAYTEIRATFGWKQNPESSSYFSQIKK